MKAHPNHQSSSDPTSRQWTWVTAWVIFALLTSTVFQVGCVSANGFAYGFNEDGDSSDGAIRTSRLSSNARSGVELDVADKSLGEVFSTLSKKTGAPVLLGLGVEPAYRISGVFIGKTWGDVLDEVCAQNGFVAEAKLYQSGKLEAYLISKRD